MSTLSTRVSSLLILLSGESALTVPEIATALGCSPKNARMALDALRVGHAVTAAPLAVASGKRGRRPLAYRVARSEAA